MSGWFTLVKSTMIGFVNVVILKKSKESLMDTTQNAISNGDNIFALFVINEILVCVKMIKHAAIEKRNATFKKRLPEGSKLIMFAKLKNSNENPNNLSCFFLMSDLKKSTDTKIRLK